MSQLAPLSVEYKFSRRDFLHFNLLHQLRSPIIWLFTLPLPLIIALTTYGAVPEDESLAMRIITVLIVVGITATVTACGIIVLITITVLLQPGLRTLLGRKRISLTEDAVLSESEFIRSANDWRGIRKLGRGKHYLVMYNTALTAYVIPRRAFIDDAAWDRFYEFARHRMEMVR